MWRAIKSWLHSWHAPIVGDYGKFQADENLSSRNQMNEHLDMNEVSQSPVCDAALFLT